MTSEAKASEHRPFLNYSDDPSINESESHGHYHHSGIRRNKFKSYSIVFIITSLAWITVLIFLTPLSTQEKSSSKPGDRHNITTNAQLLTCGNSTQEARALGCKYDILLNNWVPAPCLDSDFIEEYKDDASWAAFADVALTQRLTSVEEMSEMDVYYTSVRDHINHCAVMWKKQFWALYEEQAAFDTVIASPRHTDHCAQFLMDVTEGGWDKPTRVKRGFAGCWVRGERK